MSKQDDGGPAFPHHDKYDADRDTTGMTLRDWFAGQALAGTVQTCNRDTINNGMTIEQHFAGQAYAIADAMLAARKETT